MTGCSLYHRLRKGMVFDMGVMDKFLNYMKLNGEDEDDYYDDEYDDYDDDKVSKAPIIILGIAIIVVAAAIAYLLFFK